MITKRINTLIWLVFAGLVALTCILSYSMFIEPGWMKENRYATTLTGYPKGAGEFRVLQMSDIHRGPFTGDDFVKSVIEMGNGMKPDVVLLTGDYISESPNYCSSVAADIAGLKAPLGFYAVLGNKDYEEDGEAMKTNLEDNGVKVLTNQNVRLKNNVWIIGIDDSLRGKPDIKKAFAGVPAGAACVVITHNPAIIEKIPDNGCLFLSSQFHKSRWDPPIFHWSLGESTNRKNAEAGWRKIGDKDVYLNRGIGMTSFPFRFNARPEITLFRITGGK